MALSDFIRKIEQSPRSTKVAAGVAGVFLASSALLLYIVFSQPEAEAPPEPIARTRALPAQPAPTATVPPPTPAPTPTPKVNTPTPKPAPTSTPIPTATPGPSIGDYYVIIRRGNTGGSVEFCADYPGQPYGYEDCGIYAKLDDVDAGEFFIDYLLDEGTITPDQHKAYYLYADIELYLDDLAPAIHKLVKTRGYRWIRDRLGFSVWAIDTKFLYYYDEHRPLGVSSVASPAASDREGYVVITDGSMETVITNDDGGTSRVKIETVDTEDLLEYLLRQGKITVEQKNSYGETQTLEISLESAADALTFFDWEYSSKDGVSIEGVAEEDIDYIRRELLPLFLPD